VPFSKLGIGDFELVFNKKDDNLIILFKRYFIRVRQQSQTTILEMSKCVFTLLTNQHEIVGFNKKEGFENTSV